MQDVEWPVTFELRVIVDMEGEIFVRLGNI